MQWVSSFFGAIWRDFDNLEHWYKPVSLLLLAAYVLAVVWDYYRGTQFIARVLYGPGMVSRVRAAKKMAILFGTDLSLAFPDSTRRFRAARLIAEMEILNPPDTKPNSDDFSLGAGGLFGLFARHDRGQEREWQKKRKEWHEGERERQAHVRLLVKQELSTEPGSLAQLWTGLRRLIGAGVADPQPSKATPFKGFAELDESRALIRRYFNVLATMRDKDRRFVSKTEIEGGYMAPLFLITGILNRFSDDDGWSLILDNYRHLVANDDDYSLELRELRSFMFNCWLLWGPSIPYCSCDHWKATTSSSQNDMMLQYGYGDENNSIDVVVKDGRLEDFVHQLASQLVVMPSRAPSQAGLIPIALCAAPSTVTGHLQWGPNVDVGAAQRLIQGGSREFGNPGRGRIVLECKEDECRIHPSDSEHSARYYSAYLWIMLVIVDENGKPFYASQPWKNLLPYFEHGNIADASTYQTLKENLVAKICSSLTEILERNFRAETGSERRLMIRYACAFDDSNCGGGKGVVFPPAEIPVPGGQKKTRLVDLLQTAILASDRLKQAQDQGWIRLTKETEANPFSACELPAIVEHFYKDLEDSKQAEAA